MSSRGGNKFNKNMNNKYNSILVAIEFNDLTNKIQESLDSEQILKDKGYSIGLMNPEIRKINPGKPSEIFISLSRIQYQEKDYLIEKTNEISNIIDCIYSARQGLLNESIVNDIKFCGAIFNISFDIDETDLSFIEKMFNMQEIKKEVRNFNFKSEDQKFNYNIAVEYDHHEANKKIVVNFDCNNIYQIGTKTKEGLNEIITEIKEHIDDKNKLFTFIQEKLK